MEKLEHKKFSTAADLCEFCNDNPNAKIINITENAPDDGYNHLEKTITLYYRTISISAY